MCPIFDSTKIASLFDKRWKCQGLSLLYVCGLLRMETRSRQYARLSYSIYYGVKTTTYWVWTKAYFVTFPFSVNERLRGKRKNRAEHVFPGESWFFFVHVLFSFSFITAFFFSRISLIFPYAFSFLHLSSISFCHSKNPPKITLRSFRPPHST